MSRLGPLPVMFLALAGVFVDDQSSPAKRPLMAIRHFSLARTIFFWLRFERQGSWSWL